MGGGHQLRDFADRGVGPAHHWVAAQERPDGLQWRIDAGLGGDRRAALVANVQERTSDEAQPRRARQRLLRHLGGDPVADRVLAGAGLEPGWKARQHRGVAEQLALAEEIEDAAVENDLDRARPDDPQVFNGLGALREDRRAGAVEFDLRRRGHAFDLAIIERVERRMLVEKAGYLGRRGGAHARDLR